MADEATSENTDFWNVNVPPHLQTKECPDFLTYAFTNDKDRGILSTKDAEYHRQTWQEVQQFIRGNRLELFERLPSDLRRYREYCLKLEREYGTVMAFVMQERLKWKDLTPKGAPFAKPDDIKILLNDWPYGVDSRIVHLVVWTKFELQCWPTSTFHPTGDLMPLARMQIRAFVDETFVRVCGKENVIWFKNWSSLKSIHAVEHFHVMLFNPDRSFVERITGGDVALADKVRMGDGV